MADARQFLTPEIAALCNVAGVTARTVEHYPNVYMILKDGIVIGDIWKTAPFEDWQRVLTEMLKHD